MLPPQSDDEVRPVEDALKRLDPLLAIQWNPRSLVDYGPKAFDVYGLPKEREHRGLWEVVRYETHERSGKPALICRVCSDDGNQTYRPVGWWLVEYMQRWDAAQAHYAAEMEKAWAAHEARFETQASTFDQAKGEEALDRIFTRFVDGGSNWQGKGVDLDAHGKIIHTVKR